MSEPFTIREAESRDAAGILALLATAFAPYRASYTTGAYADTVLTAETLRERMAAMTVLVAADAAGRVVGSIACKVEAAGEGHIRGMAVLPDFQGSGVADSLLGHAEGELRKRGCRLVKLDTTRPLARAIRFYRRNGFCASGAVHDFFGMELFEYRKVLG